MSGPGLAAVALGMVRHPATLIALVVLVVNDHILKSRWPGVVTGKVSDVVWPWVAAPIVALLLVPLAGRYGRRRWASVAAVVTAVPFVAVNLSAAAADAAARMLSAVVGPSSVVVDPTDLLVLPTFLVPWYLLRHHDPPPPVRSGAPPRVLTLVLLGLATLGTAATSCFDGRPAVFELGTDDGGRLLAVMGSGDGSRVGLATSPDGGFTWEDGGQLRPRGGSYDEALGRRVERLVAASEGAALERCDEEACYRLDPDEESLVRTTGSDATTTTLSDPSRLQVRQRALQGPVCAGAASRPGAVDLTLTTAGDGGTRVVVSHGLEGVLLVDGDEVREVEVLGAAPADPGRPQLLVVAPELAIVSVAATALWLIVSLAWWTSLGHAARTAGHRGSRRWTAWLLTALGGVAALAAALVASFGNGPAVGWMVGAPVLAVAVGVAWWAFWPAAPARRLPLHLAALLAAPALAATVVVLAWSIGFPRSYPAMGLSAMVSAGVAFELVRRRMPFEFVLSPDPAAPGPSGPLPPGSARSGPAPTGSDPASPDDRL